MLRDRNQTRSLVTSVLAACLAACTACGGGGSTTPRIAPLQSAAAHSSLSVSIDVPSGAATPSSAKRSPSYISVASKSIVFTIDQPDLDQTDLQHRTQEFDLKPGVNTLALDLEDGELTLQATIYDASGGKGHELSLTDPQTLTLDHTAPTTIDLTFNPIIVQTAIVITSVRLLTLYHAANSGGDTVTCYGLAGQFGISGLDAAGYYAIGAGHFLDVHHNPTTVSPGPAGLIEPTSQPSQTIAGGGVAVSGGAFTTASGGSFTQTTYDVNEIGVALGARASSTFVKPQTTYSTATMTTFALFATPACQYNTGG